MKHLKLFKTITEYETFVQSSEYVEPHVSYCEDDMTVHYNLSSPTPSVEYVDLGLASGTKWMKYNLGATSETEYGLYYQWGAVDGYTDDEALAHSSWTTTPFNGGADEYDNEYWTSHKSEAVDSNNELLLVNDCIYQATGGVAKLPTKAQIEELISLSSEWIEDYNGSGVNGRLFTGTNGNTLFIPAAGCYDYDYFSGEGEELYYWSVSLYEGYEDYAWYLYAYREDGGCYERNRYVGMSVRGVLC